MNEFTLVSATFLLIIVMDPVGNLPVFLSIMKDMSPARQRIVIAREACIAFGILVAFLFFGKPLMSLLHLSEESLQLSGGIILFLIAIKMIFPSPHGLTGEPLDGEPLIFPLAVPLMAGPSAATTVMIFAAREPEKTGIWLAAIAIASTLSLFILLSGTYLKRFLGIRGLRAFERLMGLLLTAISVEMIVQGIQNAGFGQG